MMTLQEWKELGGLAILVFSIMLITMYLISIRIENKAQKRRNKQVICQKQKKIFNARNFISNYDEFIAENTKGMTLYEIKEFKRNVELELVRMIG